MKLDLAAEDAFRDNAKLLCSLAAIAALIIFLVDAFTPLDIAIAVLYVGVLLLVALSASRRMTIAVIWICVMLTVLGFVLSHSAQDSVASAARCVVSLLAIATVSMLALRNQANTETLRKQVELLNLTHDAVVVYDLDDRITFWNQGAEQLYGWTSRQATGQSIHLLTQTHAAIPIDEIRRETLTKGSWRGELQRVRKNGDTVFVSSRWTLSRDRRGKPLAILATNNDVTEARRMDMERQRAEDALKRSEAFLSDAQRLSHTGSIATRLPSGKMWWSDETYRIFGYAPDAHASIELILARTHATDKAVVEGAYRQSMAGEPSINVTHRLHMPDGAVRHVNYVARLSMSCTEETEYVGALMDITDRVQAQEALERSRAELAHVTRVSMLGELAASVAHEVTQPLAAIATAGDAATRWLNREPPEVGEAAQSIAMMSRDARRATDIIRRIRSMAQKRDRDPVVVDLNLIVRESIGLVRRELETQHVEIEADYAHPAPNVCADRVQLQQVVINLLMNAMQAMSGVTERKRSLRVATQRFDERHGQVIVEDSGVGIDEANVERLFNAFFTTRKEGMGMGLSICRSIVEAHGGRIWAESRQSRGALVQFILPLEEEACDEQ